MKNSIYQAPTPFRVYSDSDGNPVRAVIYATRIERGRKKGLCDVVDIRPGALSSVQFSALLIEIEPTIRAAIERLQP